MELEALAFNPLMSGLSTQSTITARADSAAADNFLSACGDRIVVAGPIQDGYDRPKLFATIKAATRSEQRRGDNPDCAQETQAIFFLDSLIKRLTLGST